MSWLDKLRTIKNLINGYSELDSEKINLVSYKKVEIEDRKEFDLYRKVIENGKIKIYPFIFGKLSDVRDQLFYLIPKDSSNFNKYKDVMLNFSYCRETGEVIRIYDKNLGRELHKRENASSEKQVKQYDFRKKNKL